MSSNGRKLLGNSKVQFISSEVLVIEKGNTVRRPDSEDKGDIFCSRHARLKVTSRSTSRASKRQD